MSRFFRSVSDSESESSSEEEELLTSGEEDEGAAPKAPKKKAAAGSDESDSEAEEESDQESDDEGARPQAAAAPRRSRFMRGEGDSDEDSDEDVRKVVKSAKDKRIDEMVNTVKSIENAQRIDDWVAISKDFDQLARLVQRHTNVAEPVPVVWLKALVQLEDFLTASVVKEKDSKKKMKAPNAKAMNTMKQKLKKTAKSYEDAVEKYKKDPEAFEREAAAIPAAEAEAAAAAASKKEKRKAALAAAEGEGEEDDEDFQTVGKGGKAMVFTTEGLFKNLQAILEARGRKNTDRTEQLLVLSKLLAVAATPYQRIRVLLALVSARFDYNPSMTAYLPIEMWSKAREEINDLVQLLNSERGYIVMEETEDYDELEDRVPGQNGEGDMVKVRGSIISFVERLDDEFTKSLQNIDPHSTEYIERLSDEKALYHTIVRAQTYFEVTDQKEAMYRVLMRRIEHIYSKPDAITQALEQSTAAALPDVKSSITATSSTAVDGTPALPSTALMHSLCLALYPQTYSSRLRTNAMLCQIYHHSLHNNYHGARDLLLMSHLQESIHNADPTMQMLYNRVVVQLGLAAFRLGYTRECQAALLDIFTTGRVRELLGQGLQKQSHQYPALTPEQEKLERQRQLPFHMHINIELLEAAYLVSSMLLEIPHMAAAGNDPELRKKVISRPFRRMLDYTDRQVFTGPPETTRDHIMQASRALQMGDWRRCQQLIEDIKIWKLMPGEKDIKEVLKRKIQEEGLRTYLFAYSNYYSTVSFSHLASTFALPQQAVVSIVSKMIWFEELAASLDQTHEVVVLHRHELSKVQQLAQTLADKAAMLVEQNERALDAKLGDGPFGSAGGGRGDREGGREGAGGRGGEGKAGEGRGGADAQRRQRTGGRGGYRGGRGARRDNFQGLGRRVAAA